MHNLYLKHIQMEGGALAELSFRFQTKLQLWPLSPIFGIMQVLIFFFCVYLSPVFVFFFFFQMHPLFIFIFTLTLFHISFQMWIQTTPYLLIPNAANATKILVSLVLVFILCTLLYFLLYFFISVYFDILYNFTSTI